MANAESTTAGGITEAAKATGEVTPTIDSASTNSITNAGETVNGKDMPKNKGRLKTVAEKFAEDHKTESGGRSYSINPDFAEEIDNWDGKSRKTFAVGTTFEALQSIGVKNRTVKWASDSIGKNHGIENFIKNSRIFLSAAR